MVKVFVGNGQILNINHTIANVNFDAEDQQIFNWQDNLVFVSKSVNGVMICFNKQTDIWFLSCIFFSFSELVFVAQ